MVLLEVPAGFVPAQSDGRQRMASSSTATKGPGAAAVDAFVAKRLRLLRMQRQVTQMQLAVSLGVSTQLIHKYESGRTRISPGRLYLCARLLEVSVDYFFEPLDGLEGPNPLLPRRSSLAGSVGAGSWQAGLDSGHD
jgi:DNA-binding transcriptional regulator YiaG